MRPAHASRPDSPSPRGIARWIAYQRERFPLLAHGLLIAAFSGSAVCFSALVRHEPGLPDPRSFFAAFVTSLLFFLQLRIADEFKDAADDARWRPYRPVPRGLVSLRELGWIAIAAAVVQALIALWLSPALLALLLLPWSYFTLMSREFFAPAWLKRRPVLYAASHMVILPLVDLYATACEWHVAGPTPPTGLLSFLLVSYANGIVIEIGRKTRAPADEEPGVETYSAQWGPATAARIWIAAMAITGLLAWEAALRIGIARPIAIVLAAALLVCSVVATRFARALTPGSGVAIERAAGAWTLLLYLSLGAVPALVRLT
jgi:4-hydroxybenzoate polyprenyltransferase